MVVVGRGSEPLKNSDLIKVPKFDPHIVKQTSFSSIWNDTKKLIKLHVYLHLRLLNYLLRKRTTVELANPSTIKDIVPDTAPIIAIDSALIHIINSRMRIIAMPCCITPLVAWNHPTCIEFRQNGGLIVYKISVLFLPIKTTHPMMKIEIHRINFKRSPAYFLE